MDKEEFDRILERRKFITNNGRILCTLNLLDIKECTLSNLRMVMSDVANDDFNKSMSYLVESEYIRIEHPKGISCLNNNSWDAPVKLVVTKSGIELLMGLADNPAVEV